MNQYVGLDVSLEQTAFCVVDDNGKPLWQGKCASTPEMLVGDIRTRAAGPDARRSRQPDPGRARAVRSDCRPRQLR